MDILRTIVKYVLRKGVVTSYAQNGEDVYLMSLIRKSKGTFVDVGAFHPIQYSNTYALYKKGWRGINIDPNEKNRKLFSLFRSKDIFINKAVGSGDKILTYYYFNHPALNTCDKEEAEKNLQKSWVKLLDKKILRVETLEKILAPYKLKEIDFLSIDIEGLDYEVLVSHDWNIKPKFIAIEKHFFDIENIREDKIYSFLKNKGYSLVGILSFTIFFKLEKINKTD